MDRACLFCKKIIEHSAGSAYSVCFDPEWERNSWGGDTHEYLAFICDACAVSHGLQALIKTQDE